MSVIVTALEKALKTDPANWETRLSLTESYLKEDRGDDAVTLFEDVTLPESESGLIAAARCYALLDSPHAGEILDPVLAANPDNGYAQLALAFIAHRNGDTDTAREAFTKANSLGAVPSGADAALVEAYSSAANNEPISISADDEVPAPDVEVEVGAMPHAGELPVEAIDATGRIRPLIDPKSIPDAAKPIVEAPSGSTAKVQLPDIEVKEVILAEPTQDAAHILVAAAVTEDGERIASPDETIRAHQEEAEIKHRKDIRKTKLESLLITAALHVGTVFILGAIVIAVPRADPPQIVAVASATPPIDTLEKKKVLIPTQATNTKPPSARMNVVSVASTSDFAIPSMKNTALPDQAVFGTAFTPTLDFAPAGLEGMPTLFGEKIEGKTLGVILDVSGSMADYLPKVVREIDRNFEKASIVFVNDFILRDGITSDSEIRPILTDDVKPHNTDKTRTPYWFLWHDLPTKAEQASVDRLITIFKERPNCYLADGGANRNRIQAAMGHLRSLGIDALYLFSDYEDYIDEEITVENARILSKADIKVYVQPAQERTEFLQVMTSKLAHRTGGKELKSLIKALEIVEEKQPLLADVTDPKPIQVEGVTYATQRLELFGKEFYEHRGIGGDFKPIQTYQEKTFDLVLYGPSARATIFLKNDQGGYIGRPIEFRYHSRKWVPDERGDLRWRQRKWLRNAEEPKIEGNEIIWKMILEDEQTFDVWFRFDENSFIATYAASLVPQPEDKSDYASAGFYIPPMATQKDDIYYSVDFPEGRNLDKLREAMKVNYTVFNLSSKERDRYATQWKLYGWEPGSNIRGFDVLNKDLPDGLLEARVSGQSFGPRILKVKSNQNDILLRCDAARRDIELWQGFTLRLHRDADQTRHRLTKTEAFELTIE